MPLAALLACEAGLPLQAGDQAAPNGNLPSDRGRRGGDEGPQRAKGFLPRACAPAANTKNASSTQRAPWPARRARVRPLRALILDDERGPAIVQAALTMDPYGPAVQRAAAQPAALHAGAQRDSEAEIDMMIEALDTLLKKPAHSFGAGAGLFRRPWQSYWP